MSLDDVKALTFDTGGTWAKNTWEVWFPNSETGICPRARAGASC